ncbi:MAG: hypothetical protein R2911_40900 [Caldilineaceae bacterium]
MMHNSAVAQTADALNSVQQARRGLTIYFAILLPITALIEGYMIKKGAMIGLLVLLLMFMPTLASVIARLTLREGFGDVSFRLGGRRGAGDASGAAPASTRRVDCLMASPGRSVWLNLRPLPQRPFRLLKGRWPAWGCCFSPR